MLEACQQYVVAKQSNLTHWHPILGWLAQKVDTYLQEPIPYVKSQLACLWTGRIVSQLIGNERVFVSINRYPLELILEITIQFL